MIRFLPSLLFALALLVPASAAAQTAPRAPIIKYWPIRWEHYAPLVDRVNELSGAASATGKVTLPSSGAWVDLYRVTPGNSKVGAVQLLLLGESSAPSRLTATGRIEYATNGSGAVYVVGSPGNTVNTGDADVPTTPSAPTVNVQTTFITVSWTATSGNTRGWELQYSPNGSVWTTYGARLGRTTLSASFTGIIGPASAVQFRVRAFNDFGASAWSSAVSTTTGGAHTSTAQSAVTETMPVPVTSASWDDTRHYIDGDGRAGGSGGDLQVQAIGSAGALVIRARTYNSKTGTLHYNVLLAPH